MHGDSNQSGLRAGSRTDQADRGEAVAREIYLAVVAGLFSLPFLARWVAVWLGWEVFFLNDGRIQSVWATVVQFWAGWRYYAGALSGLRTRRPGEDLAVALAATAVYGLSLYQTFGPPAAAGEGALFEVSALVIFLATLTRLAAQWTAPGASIVPLSGTGAPDEPGWLYRLRAWLVPVALIVAIGGALGWVLEGVLQPEEALLRAAAVVLVAAPSAAAAAARAPTAAARQAALGVWGCCQVLALFAAALGWLHPLVAMLVMLPLTVVAAAVSRRGQRVGAP